MIPKFRAWDKSNSEMLKVDCINWYMDEIVIYPDNELAFSMKLENIELMQYTGRKDKNGVEIYEGDIVRFSNNHIHDQTITVCQWLDYRTGFVYKFLTGQYKGQFTDMADTWREYEVIGNIYENPELLED